MVRFEFTGGLEDFTSEEGSADAGNRDEAGSNALEAFLWESSPARAPWRSPEEVARHGPLTTIVLSKSIA